MRVIRDILKVQGSEPQRIDDMLPSHQPMWETRTESLSEPTRRRKRGRNMGPKCPHCDGDISEAQVTGSETTDDKTVLTKECPSCKKAIKVDA